MLRWLTRQGGAGRCERYEARNIVCLDMVSISLIESGGLYLMTARHRPKSPQPRAPLPRRRLRQTTCRSGRRAWKRSWRRSRSSTTLGRSSSSFPPSRPRRSSRQPCGLSGSHDHVTSICTLQGCSLTPLMQLQEAAALSTTEGLVDKRSKSSVLSGSRRQPGHQQHGAFRPERAGVRLSPNSATRF